MTVHPRIKEVAVKFEAQELHAARSGREVMDALALVVAESSAASIDELAAELALNAESLLEVMPAYAPPINVLHRVFARLEHARRDALPVSDFRVAIAEEGGGLWPMVGAGQGEDRAVRHVCDPGRRRGLHLHPE